MTFFDEHEQAAIDEVRGYSERDIEIEEQAPIATSTVRSLAETAFNKLKSAGIDYKIFGWPKVL